jgi:transcriptional regulator with XRE-family HTH domain
MNELSLSSYLRVLRQSHGLSLQEAAEEAALSKSTLSRIESGLQIPGLLQLERLAALYQTTISDMLAGKVIDHMAPSKHQRDNAMNKVGLLTLLTSLLAGECTEVFACLALG